MIVWGWSKQCGILLAVIRKSCLCWCERYWVGLKLRKWVTENYWPKGGRGGGCCAVTLHLTSPTLQELSQHQQIHMSSLTFPTIFPWAIAELLGIIPRKLREMTIRITLWRLWERKPHKEIFCSKMHKVLLNF